MSRMLKVIGCLCFVALITLAAHSQSVGDAAKANKDAQKPRASKTYTNDDIPSAEEPAPVAEKKEADAAAADNSEAKEEPENAGESKPENSAKAAKAEDKSDEKAEPDPKQVDKEWKDKVAAQKQKIADLEKEQQLNDREYKLRAAVFYADAGNRLRDDKKWADTERKYKSDTAKLDEDIKTAKEQLETMREQARKAGVKVD